MERAEGLLALYEEMGVPRDRVLVRVPATWEGIQAAKALEAQGVATHLILVYRRACLTRPRQCRSNGLDRAARAPTCRTALLPTGLPMSISTTAVVRSLAAGAFAG